MLTVHRDLETVASGVARWLRARRGVEDLTLRHCERASDGLSSETLLIDADGSRRGRPYFESLVVRLPPAGPGAFPNYDLAAQARAQEAAAAGGVPTAVPVELETDTTWLGAPFLIMARVAGHVAGRSPVGDPWIIGSPPQTQALLYQNFLDVLASIHRLDWRHTGLGDVVPVRDLGDEVAYWARYLEWCGEDALVPTLTNALSWCDAHRPSTEPPPSLLWGDVRLGNVIFDEQRRPVAILDWEMTTIGPAEHDIAWYLGLEALEHELLGQGVPGFPDRDTAIAHYQARLGRVLQDLEWFETFALIRSTAILARIVHLQRLAGQPSFFPADRNPILEIIERRIAAA